MSSPTPAGRHSTARAQYLLRFDDICPTMNWRVWEEIEGALQRAGARPILAVVPDNRDPKLAIEQPAADFWERVRAWQARGWSIALHGYQHRYGNAEWGILRLTRQSEFAGLPRAEQEEKLRRGLAVLAREGVHADCWVAPSHSFDWVTVTLLAEMGLRVISDGLWPWPHTDPLGITWVPQQVWDGLWRRGPGVWTSCYHHNHWSAARLARFRRELTCHAPHVTSLHDVLLHFAGRRLTWGDRLAARWRLLRSHCGSALAARLPRQVRRR